MNPAVTSGLQPSFVTAAFGQVDVGSAATAQTLTLTNTSGSSIVISSLPLSGIDPSEFSESSNCIGSLAAASSCMVQLGFTPLAGGRRVATPAINSSATNTPVLVELSGVGVNVTVPAPTLTGTNPATLTTTGVATTVTLSGSGFTSSTIIFAYGTVQATTYISPQAVSFVLPASYLAGVGNIPVYVRNSGGISSVLEIPVGYPAPTLTSLSRAAVLAGSPNFLLTLNGSNLESTSTVLINGVSHTTFSANSTNTVEVSVASSEVAATGTLNVSVVTPSPGGGTSASLPLQVTSTSNLVHALPYATADLVTDPVRTLLYASVGSSSATSPNSIIAIDPVQGAVIATHSMATSPDRIAVSDDGSYLYVSLPSTAQVDASTGALVGQLASSGYMVTDSTLNRAYVLRFNNTSSAAYALDIFNLTNQTLINSIPVPALSGNPTQILRWGPQGIAILTDNPGMLYLLQGSAISGLTSPVSGAISLNPANLVVGSASRATVTVTGTGFLPTSTVLVDSVAQPTTYVSPTQLTFQLNAGQGASARYVGVVVSNAASGGSASPATTLEIDNALPTISSLSSTSFPVGSSSDSVTIAGTGFAASSVVQCNGTTIAATYNSPTSLSVTIPYNYTSTAGSVNLTVSNPAPGGGTSAPVSIAVVNPTPSITGLSVPGTVPTGTAAQTIVINGAGFLPSTVIQINGNPLTTTYGGGSQVSVSLPGTYLSVPGTLVMTAVNPAPGGGASAPFTLTVDQNLPDPITLVPATIAGGGSTPATITLTGSNFLPSSVVQLNGQSRTTTYVNPTELTFVLTVAEQAATGTYFVKVINPVASGGASPNADLTITTATGTPSISSVSPTQFNAYSGSSSIVVYVTGITSSSTILWNGTPLEESQSYPQSGYIFGIIQANLLGAVGTDNITVNTPGVTPSVSNAVTVSVVY